MRIGLVLEEFNTILRNAFVEADAKNPHKKISIDFAIDGCIKIDTARAIKNGKNLDDAVKYRRRLIVLSVNREEMDRYSIDIRHGLLTGVIEDGDIAPYRIAHYDLPIVHRDFIGLCKWFESLLRSYVKFNPNPILSVIDTKAVRDSSMIIPDAHRDDNEVSYLDNAMRCYHEALGNLTENHKEDCLGELLAAGKSIEKDGSYDISELVLTNLIADIALVMVDKQPIAHAGLHSVIDTGEKVISTSVRILIEQFPMFGRQAVGLQLCTLRMNEIISLNDPVVLLLETSDEFVEKFNNVFVGMVGMGITEIRRLTSQPILASLIYTGESIDTMKKIMEG